MEADDEVVALIGTCRDPRAVDGEKCINHGERGALVSVDERVVLPKALPKRRRFFVQVSLMACLRPVQVRIEEPGITYAVRSTIVVNLIAVNDANLHGREIVSHSASFL
jgi:hypothetical protein